MTEQWCKCRIVEPRIVQRGDALVCFNCHTSKELPPKVDFLWVKQKKELLDYGKLEYMSYTKEALVEMLLARDEQLLEDWLNSKPYEFMSKRNWETRILKVVPYLCFENADE